MEYDREQLNELNKKIDLLEYASKTIKFKKVDSHNYACHCPLHIDKTPSLIIDAKDNYFYCFSCKVSGGIINWLRIFEKCTFTQAIEKAAKLADVNLNNLKASDSVLFYKKLFNKDDTPLPERTILNKSDYDKYDDELPNEWLDEGISPESIKKYEVRIDKKSNRIVYPVYDNSNNLIGVKGRTRFKNYKALKIMKYINYNKIGTVDYFAGMKQAYDEIIKTKEIIIFEGIKSVMKMDTWGYHNCVSTETSHINKEQIKILIKIGVKNVVIAYDKGVNVFDLDIGLLKRFTNVYGIVDRWDFLNDKDAPVDKGLDVWLNLYEGRVRL